MPTKLGIKRERQVRKHLEEQGWFVIRPGGSLGCADLVALRDGNKPSLIQVKADKEYPFQHFGPTDRQELLNAAGQAGADCVLAWWPPYGELIWIEPSAWPS